MIVASRYAKSLIDLAVETKQLEEVRKDMQLIKDVCRNNREFVVLLESPVVKTDKKQAVLESIFSGKVSKTTETFLKLMTSKRRENYLSDISKAFDEQYKTLKKITTVQVTTATAMDSSTKSQILDLVKKSVSGEIELVEKVDGSLIGGFVLTINDRQVDQSVKRKLNDLRKDFSGNAYIPNLN